MHLRGQSTVETMIGLTVVLLVVVVAGIAFPGGRDALVIAVGEWVARYVEIP